MQLPISVFIIAKNEEERISKAINSVAAWVDEVIVIDSGSTDKTVEIASKLGAKVMFNEWNGYGPQKVFGEKQCRNDWILNIDADEEIPEKLKNEIQNIFKNSLPEVAAFKMCWQMIFFSQKKPPLMAVGSNFIRLYNKKLAGFSDSKVHDSVIPNEGAKLGELKNPVYHRCFLSMRHWADKINYYSTLQAEDWIKSGRKNPSSFRVIFEPVFTFLKAYFIRRYFLYGVDGYTGSLMYAYARTLRLAKVRELRK
jgi:glycosyltransferase involved in cell wall biosynthesis